MMRRNSNRFVTWMRIAGLVSGTLIASPLTGCEESVMTAFYNGLENLAISVVQAFFDAIVPTPSSSTAVMWDTLQSWLA